MSSSSAVEKGPLVWLKGRVALKNLLAGVNKKPLVEMM